MGMGLGTSVLGIKLKEYNITKVVVKIKSPGEFAESFRQECAYGTQRRNRIHPDFTYPNQNT
jgi:hypothetical protein